MKTGSREFRDLVKTVRVQLRLSQEDLARALGFSFATVNLWENGKVMPSKLAKAQFDVAGALYNVYHHTLAAHLSRRWKLPTRGVRNDLRGLHS